MVTETGEQLEVVAEGVIAVVMVEDKLTEY